jgi:hypothetical protein
VARPTSRPALLALLLFLAVFLPLRLWRAGIEQSLWIDETASLMLASHPVSVILDQCAVDTNPPGYFFALKAWLKLGKLLVREPGILWARSFGTLIWLVFAAGVAWIGRSLAPSAANLLLLATAGGAFAAVSANDARGYCLAAPALCFAFLLILDLYAHPERPRGAAALRWLLVACACAVALWTHLLSALVFALLCVLFALLAFRRRTLEFAGFGALALGSAALSFLPWSLKVLAGVGSLKASAVTWMTPATVGHLLEVFWYWYPFGRVGGPGTRWLGVLGVASVVVPVAAAVAVAQRRRGANPMLRILAVAGFAAAIAFVSCLWLLQRFGVMTVFYAPRYPALTAALWAAALAALAGWTTERAGWPRAAAWLLLTPWLLAAIGGQVWAILAERQGGLRAMRARFAAYLPAPGADLYVMPAELIPFFRQTFEGFRLQPAEAMPCDLGRRAEATLLDLNFWHVLDRPRDLIAREILETGSLAAVREAAAFPDWRRDYAVYRLRGIDRAAAAALCRRGLGPAPRPIPLSAAAVALPENQEYRRGWSFPEVGPDLAIRRWANRRTSEILFDRSVPAGAYDLHLKGYNPPYPSVPAVIGVSLPGETAAADRRLPEGEFTLDLPLSLRADHEPISVLLTRATWSPRSATGSQDTRVLTVLFEYAWLERRLP